MAQAEIKVVKVLPGHEDLVINFGAKNGARIGMEFLVYEMGELIVDLDTGEELGELEIIKGRGQITHIQEKMSTITSCEQVRETRASMLSIIDGTKITEVKKPFIKPAVGDLVKILRK